MASAPSCTRSTPRVSASRTAAASRSAPTAAASARPRCCARPCPRARCSSRRASPRTPPRSSTAAVSWRSRRSERDGHLARRLHRAVVRADHQVGRAVRDRRADRADRAARRAQAAGALPAPLRTQPRRAVRHGAAARRHHQARDEGALPAVDRDRLPLRARAGHLAADGAGGVRDPALRRRREHLRPGGRALRPRRRDRRPLRLRLRRDRLLRAHARRLGERLEVLVPRRDARRRAAHLLRGRDGPVARRRADDGGHAVAAGDRRGAVEHVVHRAAVRRLSDLPRVGLRGDQPRAVRPPRGRRRARRGLQHRVRRLEVRVLLLRRVREHPRRLGDRGDDVPRRLAAAVHRPARHPRPVHRARQDLRVRLLVRLDPRDAAASAL